jgi:glycerol-3-phosphate acyltransferase PlsY
MFLILIPNLNFLYLFDNSVLYNPGLYAPRDDVAKISYEFNSDLIFGLFIIMFCSTFLVLMRHKSNIYRLLHGKESKIRKHKMN